MHIKTSIEHNIVQVVILAICPLLMVMDNMSQAIFYAVTVSVCYLISAILCKMFNRKFNRTVKVFFTAIVSTFIVTMLNFTFQNKTILGIESQEKYYYTILSVICLCLDTYFIDTKHERNNYIIKVFFDILFFSSMVLGISLVTEFLGNGTILGIKLIGNFDGNQFFMTLVFKFLLLGTVGVIVDSLYRVMQKRRYEKQIVYEKYIKKIRDEKLFQYDTLRRKRLLASKIQVNNITPEQYADVMQKLAENGEMQTVEEKRREMEQEKEESEIRKIRDNYRDKLNRRQNMKHSSDVYKNTAEEKDISPKDEQKAKNEIKKAKKSKPKQSKVKTKNDKSSKKDVLKGSVKSAKVERVYPKSDNSDSESNK